MKSLLLPFFALICLTGYGQEGLRETTLPRQDNKQVSHFFNTLINYQVRAHFSIGGSAPLGMPRTIRKIEHYNPKLQLGLALNATKWLQKNRQWGIRVGVAVESKGMETEARVKNYRTQIRQDHAEVSGYFYGLVKTEVKNTYVTVPLNVVYNFSKQWNFYGGFYFSFAIDRRFRGNVSEGYLRQGAPTGPKLIFENGSRAPYDFSKEVNIFQWGTQLGAAWELHDRFFLFFETNYGITPILAPDFTAVSFSLHNIYLDLGFGYRF